MDNAVFDQISPYISLGMLSVFAVFLVIGMLFGLGRGVKRACIRLVLWLSLLVIVFFITPLIVKGLLGAGIVVAGKTPSQHADYYSDQLVVWLQENWGDYVMPFQDYIKDYAYGIVLAALNLAMFFVLYFVVKFISWIIYAIVARFAAPKRDHDGNKIKRYRGWGLLVGALQAVVLFVFFMLPVNGVIGVVNNAAVYAAQAEADESATSEQSSTQTAAVSESGSADNADSDDAIDVSSIIQKFNGPLTVYNNVMKYSGIQALSNKAFEYQLTVRVEKGNNINLVHDINSGLELMTDAKVFSKLQDVYKDGKIDLSGLTQKDYATMRKFVNKAFDLQILDIANTILADMDDLLSQCYNTDNTEKLDGTDIYVNSIYGAIIKNTTTEREIAYELKAGETVAPTNYAQFAKGLRAVVNRVAERKLDLVRDDLLNIIDLVASLNEYQVKYQGMTSASTVTKLLNTDATGKALVQHYLDLSTARLTVAQNGYAVNTPIINVIGERLSQFELVQMIGLTDFENLLVYNKVMDNALTSDADVKKLVDDLIPMFLGQKALTHDEDETKVQGNWERLGAVLLDVAGVLRDHVYFTEKLDENKAKLMADAAAKDKPMKEDTAQARAVLQYMADMAISKEYFAAHADEFDAVVYDDTVRYRKIDQFVDALYRLVNEFEPVKTFLKSKLAAMNTDDASTYMQMLIDMLDQEKSQWRTTMRNIVNAADIINNSALGDLIDEFQNLGEGESLEDLTDKLVGAITKLDADDVSDMLTNLMDIPEVNDTVQESLTKILDEAAKEDNEAKLVELFGAENVGKVQEDITNLQKTISEMNYTGDDAEKQAAAETAKEKLKDNVGDLWKTVQQYLITKPDEAAAA